MMMLEERTMMSMAAATTPPTRIHLLVMKRADEWIVWELVERLPPSTALEIGSDKTKGLDGDRATRSQCQRAQPELFPGLVMEVSGNGEVITWPGPDVLEET